ncbi:MAG TPA: type II toxin-antitoxin system Phd/YefM family antitoxin [Gemmatimonadaceae bacterium]
MKTYTYSEARQQLASLLDEARRNGEVRIRRQDGSEFVVQPVRSSASPLDVPGLRANLRPGELVSLLRDERALGERRLSLTAGRAVREQGPATSPKRTPRPKRRK